MNNNNELRKLQLTELEILKKVDQVCRQYQINYFLIAGTLLGAVRHKGFIPWNDDIDIGMLRSDYEKFIDICLHKQALGKEYYLHYNESDEDYYLPFIKVKKNNTTFAEKCNENIDTHKGIFIDVFPYDNVHKPVSFLEKLQTFIVRNIHDAIYAKYKIYTLQSRRKKITTGFLTLFSTKKLKKFEHFLTSIYNKKETNYIICFADSLNYKDEILEKSRVFPLKEISLENNEFYTVNDCEYYLRKNFGDYMKLPPESERKSHLPLLISFTNGVNRTHEN